MRLSADEQRVLDAFGRAPLDAGLHPLAAVLRCLGDSPLNPSHRAVVEHALWKLSRAGLVNRAEFSDGLTYYFRAPGHTQNPLFAAGTRGS